MLQVKQIMAYIDDTTIVDDAQDTRWIQEVAKCYEISALQNLVDSIRAIEASLTARQDLVLLK